MTDQAPAVDRMPGAPFALLVACVFLVEWLPGVIGSSGVFIDEAYYVACARRLALGYVDHPPLSIFVLRLVLDMFGDSVAAMRLVPATAAAATVWLTARLARRLGANATGQWLAALAVVCAPMYQIIFGFYSMNALELLLWVCVFSLLVEIERSDRPVLWLAVGVLLGLGLLNKHTIVLLGASLGLGLVVAGRRHLKTPWPWMAAVVACVIVSPNVYWQVVNDWPSLEFYRDQDLHKNIVTSPLAVMANQVLGMNPATLPLWGAGIGFLLFSAQARRYRHLGWIPVVLLGAVLVGQKSRPDRIAAMYTLLFAGGGVVLGELLVGEARRWWRRGLVAGMVAFGALLAPLSLPLLPPEPTARLASALGVVPQLEKGAHKATQLPQWLADRYGWEALLADVEAALASLAPDERSRVVVVTSSYGNGAPLEFHAGEGFPPVYSPHNNYFLWGPPPDPVEVAVLVGFGERGADGVMRPHQPLRELFADVRLFTAHRCRWCVSWRDDEPIWIARQPLQPVAPRWPEFKVYR